MDFLTSSILSGLVYDGFSKGYKMTVSFFKEKLQNYIFDESALEKLSDTLDKMQLDELGEHAIKRRIEASPNVLQLLREIKSNHTNINQTHTGYGDNVAGDKIINNR
ncbi:TPA: GapS6a family protein [Morganella morganii]